MQSSGGSANSSGGGLIDVDHLSRSRRPRAVLRLRGAARAACAAGRAGRCASPAVGSQLAAVHLEPVAAAGCFAVAGADVFVGPAAAPARATATRRRSRAIELLRLAGLALRQLEEQLAQRRAVRALPSRRSRRLRSTAPRRAGSANVVLERDDARWPGSRSRSSSSSWPSSRACSRREVRTCSGSRRRFCRFRRCRSACLRRAISLLQPQ